MSRRRQASDSRHGREVSVFVEPVQSSQSEAGPPLRWSGPQRAIRDIAAEASHLRLEKPAEVRLHLQRGAPANLRHHVRRAIVRLAVLVVADLSAFALMRALIRAARDQRALGDGLASWLQAELPAGYLNGWQFAAALIIGLLVTGSYGPGDQRRDSRRLFFASALASALPLWAPLWARGMEVLFVQYVLTVTLVWLVLVGERLTIDRIKARIRPPERDALDTLFVGPAGDCVTAAGNPAFVTGAEFRPIGFVDVQIPPAPGAVGHVGDIELLLSASGAKVVVVCGYLTDHQFQSVVDAALAGGCEVLSVPRSVEIAGVHPATVWRRGQPLVQLTAPSLRWPQLALKRALDLVGALIGAILLSPLLVALALLIKLSSPGPVLFTQQRVGRGGRLFRIIKLRTMVDGAERQRDELLAQSVYSDPRLFKVPADPRMTKLGRWLRRTSLDELPQLVNVLRGDMSLVGPRPPLPCEVALYEAHHYARFDVKPGMTGPWQVAGRNGVTDFERVIGLESDYIRNWSLWRDIAILIRTMPAVLRMQGAL